MTEERLELLGDDILANLAKKIGIRSNPECSRKNLISLIIDALHEDRLEKESLLNLAVSIESKKYSVTIDEQLDLSYDVDDEMVLPGRYNDNMLHFLLRDNSWGFILWDIKDSVSQKYKNKSGSVSYILRVIELDSPSYNKDAIVDFFDIAVESKEKRRYINLPNDEAFYCVELYISSEQEEIIVERSSVLRTSRNSVNHTLHTDDKIKKIVELSGFSSVDVAEKNSRSLNRILPMDSSVEEM